MCGSHHHGEGHAHAYRECHGRQEGDCGCEGREGGERQESCGCGGHHGDHPGYHHEHHRHGHNGCGCRGEGHSFAFRRHFRSRAEQIEELEAYLRALEAEAQGVRGRLEALRSTTPPGL